MAHCDEDSRDPNDDHWIFEELGSPIKSRTRRLPHRNGGTVKTYRTISTSTDNTTVDKDTYEEKLKIYADNMRKLIITARKEINTLKEENIALKQKLESSGTIECPACLFLFRPQQEHKVFPKYIKVFRGRLSLEIEFTTLEQMNHWLNANHLDVNSDGLPTVITESKQDDLLSTGSLLPQLVGKRTGLEANKERMVISTRPQPISENRLVEDETRNVSNHCKDHETPSTSSHNRASVEVHEVHCTYKEECPSSNEAQNLRENHSCERRSAKDVADTDNGRSGSDRGLVPRKIRSRTEQEEVNLAQKPRDTERLDCPVRSQSFCKASTSGESQENSSAHHNKKEISNKENLHRDVERARNVISEKPKTQITKRSRVIRKSLSSRKSRHDQRTTKCGSIHSATRNRNGHRTVKDSNGYLRSEPGSSSTSHPRRPSHNLKELPRRDKRSNDDEEAHSHRSRSSSSLRQSSHKHDSSYGIHKERDFDRDVRSKERGELSTRRQTAITERNDRSDRVNRRSRSKEVSRKRAGRDCAADSPDSKRRRSPARNKEDTLDRNILSPKAECFASSNCANDASNNDEDIDSLSDADLVIIDEEEVEDGEILE
ncbi:unnamed protein product [Cylicocyclus nassatus]|uniref:Uncharacterized protein n=1 Tax=Cylicocyclus nassatus TaxID=53992 RepID=A0AA36GPQ9_CYLNA|nr:unnamed protein product [Cylicocyclus nassatus]